MTHPHCTPPDCILPLFRRLTETRRAWNLSREEVAQRMGCAPVTLQKLELEMISPSLGMFIGWAGALGFRVSLWPKDTKQL